MSDTEVNVGKIEAFEDANEADAAWSAELRSAAKNENAAALRLGNGATVALDKEDSRFEIWHRFLNERRASNRPVYVESDATSRTAKRILAPTARYIEAVGAQPEGDRLRVILLMSQSVFSLKTSHPSFNEFRSLIEGAIQNGAQLLVTTDPDTQEIVDVRNPEEGGLESRRPPNAISEAEAQDLFRQLAFHLLTFGLLQERVIQEFNNLAAQKHIPFDYPDDCCYSRAHEMCRIMREHGIQGRKIWNYGHGWKDNQATLRLETKNHPNGYVIWRYHVAPVVAVQKDSSEVDMVMDPSIFDKPVLIDKWLTIQQDPKSTHELTDDSYYYRTPGNAFTMYDPNYSKTNETLADHRYYRDLRKNPRR